MKQYLILGAGPFGFSVATSLFDLGHEVVVVDKNETIINDIMEKVTHAVIADVTDERVLKKLGVSNFQTVIVAMGNSLEDSILATVAAKSNGAKHVISKVNSALAARVLRSVGADEVIRPEHDMGVRLAQQLSTPSIVDVFNLGDEHGVIEIEMRGKLTGSLAKLELPKRFGVQVIAVTREGQLVVSPGAEFEVRVGDQLVMIGSNDALEKLRAYLSD